jgi:hypothetical protein
MPPPDGDIPALDFGPLLQSLKPQAEQEPAALDFGPLLQSIKPSTAQRMENAGQGAPEIPAEQGMIPEPTQRAPALGEALGRIKEAAVEGWRDSPPILTDAAQKFADKWGLGGDTRAIGGILGALNAGFRGSQQAAQELGDAIAPGLGRDLAGFLEAFPAGGAELGLHGFGPTDIGTAGQMARERVAPTQPVATPELRGAVQDVREAASAAPGSPQSVAADIAQAKETAAQIREARQPRPLSWEQQSLEEPIPTVTVTPHPSSPKVVSHEALPAEPAYEGQAGVAQAPVAEGPTGNGDWFDNFRAGTEEPARDPAFEADVKAETERWMAKHGRPQPELPPIPGEERTVGPLPAETPLAAEPPRPAMTPPPRPVDAVTALIDAGGVRDPGGDLAAIGIDENRHRFAGQFLGRLINNEDGMSPNKAREYLRDNGYLTVQDADDEHIIHDIAAEHAQGQPTYRHVDLAEARDWEQAQAAFGEHERFTQARQQAAEMAQEMGAYLPSEMLDHAGMLVLEGYHPQEALQAAAVASEAERGYYARRIPKPPAGGAPLFGEQAAEPTAKEPEFTIKNDPRQLGLLGTEPSAVQAQAARDAAGPKGGQQPANEGLFAPKEPEQGGLLARREGQGQGEVNQEAVSRLADAADRLVRAAGLPKDVGVRLVDRITDAAGNAADAHYTRSMISLALDTRPEDMPTKLWHEAVHGLMDERLGLLSDVQRNTLLNGADRWLSRGDNMADLARRGYSPAEMREEAVARMGEEALARGIKPPMAYQRMTNFAERLGNWLRGQGFRTADDVFDHVMSGRQASGTPGEGGGEGALARRPAQLNVKAPQTAMELRRDKKNLMTRAAFEIKAAFNPTAVRGAKPMEFELRAHNARLAQAFDQSFHALEMARRAIDREPVERQVDFTDRMERGEKQQDQAEQVLANALRGQLDAWAKKIHGLGRGYLSNAIENYMGHVWGNYAEWATREPAMATQPEMEARARSQGMQKQPLRGSGNFLKQRSFPTQKEGIEAGLVPVTYNPVDLTLIKLQEMQRFYYGTVLADNLKQKGMARWVRAFPEDEKDARLAGWMPLDDTIFKPRTYGENMAGRNEPGNYWAPEPLARVFNNYMSQGLHGQSAIYDAFRKGNNGLNSLQLGISGFHAAFVTADTAMSKVALGLQQLSQGKPIRGMGNIASGMSGVSVVQTVMRGSELRKAWLEPEQATPEMQKIVDALKVGGGRMSMPRFYQTSASGSFFHSFADLKDPRGAMYSVAQMFRDEPSMWKKTLVVPFRMAARTLDTIQQPLMGALVPRAKLGVFADMAQNWLRDNPTATAEQVSAAMTKFADSVDNRLGQLNYDNLFWDKTMKDIAFITTRSVGWNLGTVREIGGAAADTASQLKAMAQLKKPELTTRMAYVIAMTAVTAEIGAVLTYISTGRGPQSLMDYFYPPTGDTDDNGVQQRRSIPGYMKDVIAFTKDPQQTVLNKTAPLLEAGNQIRQNRDYYGASIYDPKFDRGPFQAYGDWVLNQAAPFSVRGIGKLHEQGASSLDQALGFFGFQPAPKSITEPERGAAFEQREDIKAYKKRLREPGRLEMLNSPP